MITDERGYVAIKYRNPVPRVERGHAFVVKNHLSIAWVPPAIAAQLLRRRRNCPRCGGKVFTFASEAEVNTWRYGHPTRKPEGAP